MPILVDKQVGETPLMVLERLRVSEPKLKDENLSYAGRLDPLASGKLLVLVGDECKRQKEYSAWDKEYEVEVLLGPETDTGDVLGLVNSDIVNGGKLRVPSESEITSALSKLSGKQSWPYPAFSSKTVKSKHGGKVRPLLAWALEGRLDEVHIPYTNIEIYSLDLLETREVESSELHNLILEKVNSIPPVKEESKRLGADFRRPQVRESWQHYFGNTPNENHKHHIIKLRCSCTSGTYMRTLAPKLGELLGSPALALSIHRTRVGNTL